MHCVLVCITWFIFYSFNMCLLIYMCEYIVCVGLLYMVVGVVHWPIFVYIYYVWSSLPHTIMYAHGGWGSWDGGGCVCVWMGVLTVTRCVCDTAHHVPCV